MTKIIQKSFFFNTKKKFFFYTFTLVRDVLSFDFRVILPSAISKQCAQFGQLIFFPVFTVLASKRQKHPI
jgi:hypothetical protein